MRRRAEFGKNKRPGKIFLCDAEEMCVYVHECEIVPLHMRLFLMRVCACGSSTSVPGYWPKMLHIMDLCRFPSLVCYLKLTAAFNLYRGPVIVCICA